MAYPIPATPITKHISATPITKACPIPVTPTNMTPISHISTSQPHISQYPPPCVPILMKNAPVAPVGASPAASYSACCIWHVYAAMCSLHTKHGGPRSQQ
ncbi:unnamed protein product [Ectocarpus sp. 8 AP-2014]